MCSLVEIKNHDEIYIHYLSNGNTVSAGDDTSDRGDSIDSEVTINNCQVDKTEKLLISSSDMAVQTEDNVKISVNCDKGKLQKKDKKNKAILGTVYHYHYLLICFN